MYGILLTSPPPLKFIIETTKSQAVTFLFLKVNTSGIRRLMVLDKSTIVHSAAQWKRLREFIEVIHLRVFFISIYQGTTKKIEPKKRLTSFETFKHVGTILIPHYKESSATNFNVE